MGMLWVAQHAHIKIHREKTGYAKGDYQYDS